jgi:RNA polymerase sigma-70 factor (ECF subfamily)
LTDITRETHNRDLAREGACERPLTEPRKMLEELDATAVADRRGAWIEAARAGDLDVLGKALEGFRDYLLFVASEELDPDMRAKVGASDLVQETFLGAHRDFASFRGRTEREWQLWLRGILLHLLANHRRDYRSLAKRRIEREMPISSRPHFDWPASGPSPSTHLAAVELEADMLAALEGLEQHYRNVVLWRHRDRLPFDEIGRRMSISADAARKQWGRALLALRKELKVKHGDA